MKKIILIGFLTFIDSLHAFQSVDINRASAGQIAELPGVGLKLAKSVVSFRQKNGPYSNGSGLLAVPGMKPNKLEKISSLIIFGRSSTRKELVKSPPIKSPPTTIIPLRPVIALDRLEKMALDSMGLNDDRDAAMIARARRSAILPKVTLLFDFDRDIDLSEKKASNSSETLLMHGGHDLSFGIKAVFDLKELVFHKSELAIASLALKRLQKREKVLDRLHQYYLRYLRLQEAGQNPEPIASVQKIASELKEISLMLDSMSKGAFSQYQQKDQP